ncbi:MAG: hypothetical protein ABI488_13620 [Polyangiaceae bacterium]
MKTLAFLLTLGFRCVASTAAHAEPAHLPELPRLNVAALAASDSQLFVGGFDAGLYVVERDGTARHLDDPALSSHINALAWSERERTLWLGTARGVARCKLGVGCERLGPARAVHALLLRRDGSLIAGGDAGITFVTGEHTQSIGKKQGASYRSVWSLAESGDGTLFVGAINGLFWGDARAARHGGKLSRASIVTGALPDDWVTALFVQGSRVHVGTYNSGVVSFQWAAGQLNSESADPTLGYVNPAGVVATSHDTLAFATMDGLRIGVPGKTTLRDTQGRDITAILPAWRGGYWIGSRHGLEWAQLE